MYQEELALNNLQWLICHKTQPNQIRYSIYMYKEELALNNLQCLICHKIQPTTIVVCLNGKYFILGFFMKDIVLHTHFSVYIIIIIIKCLSPSILIISSSQQVLQTTSNVHTELM